jgi:hypothetical protein
MTNPSRELPSLTVVKSSQHRRKKTNKQLCTTPQYNKNRAQLREEQMSRQGKVIINQKTLQLKKRKQKRAQKSTQRRRERWSAVAAGKELLTTRIREELTISRCKSTESQSPPKKMAKVNTRVIESKASLTTLQFE